ncbi:hypothetical protein CQW23_23454 [Capsicum baccatum]|uniref:Putative plant transposon protein domain-containing protein n=1 Tax=Capsicum baccatum TaxID=33114 RepID=A0A2G2VRZ0_CAPBA|nr:hypothetical protein CQW23_23454 [Capsicum baccatum]
MDYKRGKLILPALVLEFYANYQAQLENMCRSEERVTDYSLLDRVQVRGVRVDVSIRTINRFLHGPNFTPQDTSPSVYARIKNWAKQHPWLANIIAERKPTWVTNPNERIYKSYLTEEAKFWWGVMRIWMMPTDGDNILDEDRAILVAIMEKKLPLNFKKIIADEIKIRMSRTKATYPFSYLIIKLCRAANVPEIAGVDDDIPARKTQNPIRYDQNQLGLRLDRGTEVAADPPVTDIRSTPNVEVFLFNLVELASNPLTLLCLWGQRNLKGWFMNSSESWAPREQSCFVGFGG